MPLAIVDLDFTIAVQNVSVEVLAAFVEAFLQNTEVETRVEHLSVFTVRDLPIPPTQASRTIEDLVCTDPDCSVVHLTSRLRRLQVNTRFLWTSVLARGAVGVPEVDLDAIFAALGASVDVELQSIRLTVRGTSPRLLRGLPDALTERFGVQVGIIQLPSAPSSSYVTLLAILVAGLSAAYLAIAYRALVPLMSGRPDKDRDGPRYVR